MCFDHLTNLGWILVHKDKECRTDDILKPRLKTVSDCAVACKNLSSMFVFDQECSSFTGCYCYCEIYAEPNGTCSTKDALSYNLYKYVNSEYFKLLKYKLHLKC